MRKQVFYMQVQETNKMGIRPVFPLLMSMAFPPMLSMLIQALYNIVDSMFVAQIGEHALTAVSLAFPIQTLIIACAVGIGVGVNSYIARKLGEKKQDEANSAVLHGLLLALVGSLLFILLGIFGIPAFFKMFTSDALIYEEACAYTYICVFFCFGCFFHICIEKVFQSTGKMIFPMAIQAIGAIINIILDPIMIFGWFGFPALGVQGAAIATVIAQITSMAMSFFVLLSREHDVKVDVKHFHFHMDCIKKILAVGVPNACMNALNSFLVMGLNTILIGFSNAAVAVFGIYFKLQSFIFMPIFGLNNGMIPIIAYNYGSRSKKRIMDTAKLSIAIAIGIMLLGLVIFQVFTPQLLMLFNASDSLLEIGIPALRTISLSFLFAGYCIITGSVFQALGNGVYSLIISVARQLLCILPLAYIFSHVWGLHAVWFAFPMAEIISTLLTSILFKRIYNKKIKVLE